MEKYEYVKPDEAEDDIDEVDETDSDEVADSPRSTFFGRLAFGILAVVIFLLPLFFFGGLLLPTAKTLLFFTAIFLLIVAAIISVLRNGSILFSKHILVIASVALPAVFLISTLFSGTIYNSFFGLSFELGTTLSILAAVSFMLIIPAVVKTKDSVFTLYTVFLLSFFIVAIFQLLRLIVGPSFMSFGVFTDATTNLIGKWNELAIFFGLSSLLSLVTLETFTSSSKSIKVTMYVVLVISLFFLGLVNFSYALIAVGIFSLVSLIYLFVTKKKVSITSLAVLIIALAFTIFGGKIQNHLPANLTVTQVEVSPSWTHTLSLTGETLRHEPIVGVGPNEFTKQWLTYKPADVNPSIFWSSDFSYAVGLIPTYFVTTGLLGILAWLFFFFALIYTAFKSLFDTESSIVSRYLIASSFFAALYLWVFQIVYIPSLTLFVFTFFFTGIFIAVLVQDKIIPVRRISYIENPKLNFAIVFGLIVILAAVLSLYFVVVKKTIASYYAEAGVSAINANNDLTAGEAYLKKAVSLDPQASYYRALAQIDISKENTILGQTGVASATIQSQFQVIWPELIDYAQKAEAADPNDYQNYLLLGDIYQSVLPLGYQDAYTKANGLYNQALVLNPHDPQIYLDLAQLEVANKDNAKAETYINDALAEKNNYTDAIYLLSQIQINEGDTADAITSVKAEAFLSPTDPTVFFELGFLEYSNKDYADAVTALNQAVSLNSDYANARYYLGLSDYQVGKVSDAIAQFEAIEKTNPGNASVEAILANLRAGKAPLATAASTTTSASKSTTKKLPVNDQTNGQ